MAISRMQNPRQLYNKGGIMNVSPRQQYGLGSFVKKAVKGVTGAVKKIAKSDLGKAALIGGLGMIPFGAGGSMFSRLGSAASGIFSGGFPSIPGFDTASKFLGGEKTLGKTLGVMAGGSLLGGLLAKAEAGDEEAIGATQNVGSLRTYLDSGYRNLGYPEDEIPALVEQGVSEYSSSQGGYANGGRIGYSDGTDFENWKKGKGQFEKEQGAEQLYREYLEDKRRQKIDEQRSMVAYGGRMKLEEGTLDPRIREIVMDLMDNEGFEFGEAVKEAYKRIEQRADGGRIGYAYGSDDLVEQASGIMGLPKRVNNAGVKELDLRDSGGFIPPVGVKEKADDIPAMLSNNEFVFTADSVREFGDGDVNKGAQRMYDMMKKLEKGGRV